MTNFQVDLEAIRAKLRSLQQDHRLKPPVSAPSWQSPPIHAPLSTHSLSYTRLVEPEPELPPLRSPARPEPPTPAAETVEALQRRSLNRRHAAPVDPEPTDTPRTSDPIAIASHQWLQSWQRLHDQVQRINQLALAQETALLDLKATAETALRWKLEARGEPSTWQTEPDMAELMLWDERQVVVPHIEQDSQGRWVITARPVDLFRAQREAEEMAQVLRDRQPPQAPITSQSLGPSLPQIWRTWVGAQPWLLDCLTWLGLQGASRSKAAIRRRSRAAVSASALSFPELSLLDIALWVTGAAIVRVGLDLLLLTFPILWPPMVLILVAFAAIAIYQTTLTSTSSLSLGYRLLLIMVGLLIGGRL
jgi:hypothetical protein